MADKLHKILVEQGPTSFAPGQLAACDDLFSARASLFYTPTSSIPDQFVASGPLSVTLPIVTPTELDEGELGPRLSPRFWTNLLQAATGYIRWRPFSRAIVTHTRFDTRAHGLSDLVVGTKALTDALKASTTGRPDGRLLYYFGAIEDDSPVHMEWHLREQIVSTAREACIHLEVAAL